MSKHKKKEKKIGKVIMEKKDEEIKEEVVAETLEEACEETPEVDYAKEIEALKEENSNLKDRMLRTQAESENFKKRLLREKEDAVRYANTALVKDLLDPIDNFSRALAAAEQTDNMEAFKSGIRMIEDNMLTLLKNNWGLEVIEQENVPFDPNEHEACLMEEVEGLSEDTVTMMLQKGYKVNGRVIRPAKVKVGKAKS